MDFIFSIYQELLFRPIFNFLFLLYNTFSFHDFGVAIVLLTVGIRLLLFPLFQKSIHAQKRMADIQPEIQKIQEAHKNNKEEQAKLLLELYKEKGVNPFSGCLPILIQLPILIALYHVFLKIFDSSQLTLLYPFVAHPEVVNKIAFGFLDLTEASIIVGIFAGLSQYLQALTMPQPETVKKAQGNSAVPDMAKILSYQMKYFFPFLIVIFSLQLPAALPLYWTVLNIFAIVQQKLIR